MESKEISNIKEVSEASLMNIFSMYKKGALYRKIKLKIEAESLKAQLDILRLLDTCVSDYHTKYIIHKMIDQLNTKLDPEPPKTIENHPYEYSENQGY